MVQYCIPRRSDAFIIQSSYESKKLIRIYSNGARQETDWIPGINLVTYKILNGMYPTKEMIVKQLKTFRGFKHRDFHIGNIIIQGTSLATIDGDDLRIDGDHPETAYPMLGDDRIEKIIRQLDNPAQELLKKFATPKKHSNIIYLDLPYLQLIRLVLGQQHDCHRDAQKDYPVMYFLLF